MILKDYSRFDAADFMLDDAFLQWVKKPDSGSNAFWESWKKEHPGRAGVLEEARQIILRLHTNEAQLPAESFHRIQAHLDTVFVSLEEATVQPPSGRQPLWQLSGNWHRIAATFALLVAAAAVLYLFLNRGSREVHYRTAYGQTRELTLPDGTVVVLNANSTLRTADWPAGQPREVWLEGEAFFRVTKRREGTSSDPRFVVHTGRVDVEVLGTQFSVNHRRGQTTVILNEGQVRLGESETSRGQPLLMKPGELVKLAADGGKVVRRRVDPEQYSSWTQHLYTFDDTPLRDVAVLLEDHFGLQVIFKDPALADRTFSATIPTRKPEVLLLALSESFGITITEKGNQLEFKSKN